MDIVGAINPIVMALIIVGLLIVLLVALLPLFKPYLDEAVKILSHKGDEQSAILKIIIALFLFALTLIVIFFVASYFQTTEPAPTRLPEDLPTTRVEPTP